MNANRYRILGITLPAVLILDQLTKWWIERLLPIGDSIPIIPGLFDIVHVTNKGAAFGFMARLPDHLRIPLFAISSSIALLAIVIYFVKLETGAKGHFIALSLILGGALGNITDRLLRSEVVDFLSFHWYDRWVTWRTTWVGWHFKLEWPAFNVADMAISCSVVWLMIKSLKPS